MPILLDFNNPPSGYVYLKWNGLIHLIKTQEQLEKEGLWHKND